MQGLRHGSSPQRAFLAAGVVMTWALALRAAIALLWWIVPLVWAVWRAVFWRPSLTAALIELVIAGGHWWMDHEGLMWILGRSRGAAQDSSRERVCGCVCRDAGS